MRVIDVMHLGRPHVIGCWEVDGALVDPGPQSSMGTLLEALDDEQPRAIVLTHIHLDHAAATGALVRRWPELEVYVHERGAPHLIDPFEATGQRRAPLRRSDGAPLGRDRPRSRRERQERSAAARPSSGCESPTPQATPPTTSATSTKTPARHSRATSPRSASHPSNLVVPPTPPPDIDIELWEKSIGIVESWNPKKLALTHFGAVESPAEHLSELRERLREEANLAKDLSEDAYERHHRERVAASFNPETASELLQAVPPEYQWRGLNRYWSKLQEKGLSG